MRACILMGSPRKNGNTNELVTPFIEELQKCGADCSTIWLYDKSVKPCTACRHCQEDWSCFGCVIDDDMPEVVNHILSADVLVLASPIYSFYCTAPMKAVLDRLVYGLNKYYGTEKGPSLWEGKKLALISTCGYKPEKGADLWENGIIRYCKHSKLQYIGMMAERHMGYDTVFMDEQKETHARDFAREIINI